MNIAIIVAMTPDRVIGFKGAMPWHLPADLKYFKRVTSGYPVLMGRRTYDSLYVKPLPGRKNIIVTRNADFEAPGCTVVNSVSAGIEQAGNAEKLFVIGGAAIYEQVLDMADELYCTRVQSSVAGDTYFPKINLAEWKEEHCQLCNADEQNQHCMEFIRYTRINNDEA